MSNSYLIQTVDLDVDFEIVLCNYDCWSRWSPRKRESHQRNWTLSQYPKIRLSVRSRKVSKPRDLYLELSDRYEIWQAFRQQYCQCACQIAKRYDNLKYRSWLRDFTRSYGKTSFRILRRGPVSRVIQKTTTCPHTTLNMSELPLVSSLVFKIWFSWYSRTQYISLIIHIWYVLHKRNIPTTLQHQRT